VEQARVLDGAHVQVQFTALRLGRLKHLPQSSC
jgi:hypothetical protein